MADYITKEELLEKLARLRANFHTIFTFQGTGLIAKDTSTSPVTEYKHSNINFVFASDQDDATQSQFYLYNNPTDEQNTYAIDGINQPTDVSILGEYRLCKGTDIYDNDGIARFCFTSQINQGGVESDEAYRIFTRIQSVEKTVGDKTYYPFITYISMPVFDNISDGVTYSDAVYDYLNNPTDAKLAVVETALENALNPHRPVYEKGNGGGAGWMGGGSGYDTGGAGGGSSYIGNYMLYEKAMYGYDVQESDSTNTKTISINTVSENNIAKYAKKGNGFARITFLGKPKKPLYDNIKYSEQDYMDSLLGLGSVQTDGINTYCSADDEVHDGSQQILNKATNLQEPKTQSDGFTGWGELVQTDGEHVYYSDQGTHLELDIANDTQIDKYQNSEFTNASPIGSSIQKDGDTVYFSQQHYGTSYNLVLNKTTGEQEEKIWHNAPANLCGYGIQTDGTNIYFSAQDYVASQQIYYNYKLNRATDTQEEVSQNITIQSGKHIQTDGVNIYYSTDSYNQYVLNKETGIQTPKIQTQIDEFDGRNTYCIDGTYYSSASNDYSSDFKVIVFRTA